MLLPRFETLATLPDESIDVTLGALCIARDLRGDLDVGGVSARLAELAAPLSGVLLEREPLGVQAAAIGRHLYETCGFRGNEADYYDPKNSLLPDVLERRTGIPISLAVLYCDVAARLGIGARGVSFPGHFIVRLEPARHATAEPPIYVDPFFGGRLLDEEILSDMLRRVSGREERIRPEYLAPAPPRAILLRMLMNLRGIYLSRGDLARALLVVDRIASLTPDSPGALRDRGLLSAKLGASQAALSDLQRFIELVPTADDADEIEAQIASLRAKPKLLN
jgi:regulator of sirC expression with transglutaminase-like and TPR domain